MRIRWWSGLGKDNEKVSGTHVIGKDLNSIYLTLIPERTQAAKYWPVHALKTLEL